MNEPDLVRTSLGAYLLGALEPSERSDVEAHLATCAPCTHELASLAVLPGLLGRLEQVDLSSQAMADPDPTLLDRILGELSRRKQTRQRKHRYLLAAAASVALLVSGTIYAVQIKPPSLTAIHERTVAGTDANTGVHATLGVRGGQSGASITLRLAGVRPGTHCQLVVVDRNQHRYIAGSWIATYEGTAVINTIVAIAPEEIATFDIQTTDGAQLVSIPAINE